MSAADLEAVPVRLIGAPKDQAIFHQGDRAECLYRVESGCVRLQTVDYTGHRRVVAFLFPGDIFCAGLTTCWASAHAISDSVVAAYALPQVWAAMAARPHLALALLNAFDQLQAGVAHQLVLGKATAELRLAWFLNWLSAREDVDEPSALITVPMGRRDIADHLGVAPETVSRMFTALEKRGQLRRDARGVAQVVRKSRRAAGGVEHGAREASRALG